MASAVNAPGRNDPCPCGSGRKYKKCCEGVPAAPDGEIRELLALAGAGQFAVLETRAAALGRRYPATGVIFKILGVALWRQGKDPLPALEQAVRTLPNDAEAATNLGNALRSAGRAAEARDAHRRALLLSPRFAEAHNNLGSALLDLEDLPAAAESFGRAVECKPAFALAHLNLGMVMQRLGRHGDAVQSFRAAVTLDPANADARTRLGQALCESGDGLAGRESLNEALALDPGYLPALLTLAASHRTHGELQQAADLYRRALELKPTMAELHYNLGVLLRMQERSAEAVESCRKALELEPDMPLALVLLGKLEADQGDFAAAQRRYERALERDPECIEALSGIPALRKMGEGDSQWLAAASRLAESRKDSRQEMHLRFALGKALDDMQRYAPAFEQYRRANEIGRRLGVPHDRAALEAAIDRLVTTQGRLWIDELSSVTLGSPVPVFVVGMPRSGTSLAEQILASHGSAYGVGEQGFWGQALGEWLRASMDVGRLQGLAADYRRLLVARAPGATHVVDKMPTNFLALGLIRVALPDARIVHMQRHPVDTCLSIYFQDFEAAYTYAHDLDDLAHAYRQYERLMDHWRVTLQAKIMLDVPYQGLIDDQEVWTRRLLEFVGLSWDPACLNFHVTPRTVATVSGWQVRQPLNRNSVARWRHYREFIAPLLTLIPEAP